MANLTRLNPRRIASALHSRARRVYQPILNQRIPRRFHAYAVGLPRTGTHFINEVFAPVYRSKHETLRPETSALIYRHVTHQLDQPAFERRLRERDRFLWLEMEANNTLTIIAPALVRLYPEAKFILLLRDPFSWLHSLWKVDRWFVPLDRQPIWYQHEQFFKYGMDNHAYTSADQPLKDVGLFPLAAYLNAWRRNYELALEQIPAERRLDVYTRELSQKFARIAAFVGADASRLDPTHANRDSAKGDAPFFFEIDRDYFAEQVDRLCNPLLRQLFPDITRVEDAVKPPD